MARTRTGASKKKYRFSSGILLLDDGSRDEVEIVLELLSSNGTTVYTAIRWKLSQLVSCNCPGWAFKKDCKHAREVRGAKASTYRNRETALLRQVKESVMDIGDRRSRGLKFNNSSE
jgi:hypothetical protein